MDYSECQKKSLSEFIYSYGKELFSILDVTSFPNLEDEEKVAFKLNICGHY